MMMSLTAYLPDVIEVSMRHTLLSSQLLHLIEQVVQVELGRQVGQAAVGEGLAVVGRYERGKNSLTS